MWAKIDDAILDNPKIIAAGPLGFALHVAAITWCARNLTDGHIPKLKGRVLLELDGIQTVISRLVQVGLWHEHEHSYEIHDFLVYNPSKASVLRRRKTERIRIRGRRCNQLDAKLLPSCTHPVPVPVPVPEKKQISDSRTARSRSLPTSETLTPERLEMARGLGLTDGEAHRQWALLQDHEFRDPHSRWDAVWRNWCRRSPQFSARAGPGMAQTGARVVPGVAETRELLRRLG